MKKFTPFIFLFATAATLLAGTAKVAVDTKTHLVEIEDGSTIIDARGVTLTLGGFTISDATGVRTVFLGAANGVMFGAAGDKIGFMGAAPVVRQTGNIFGALTAYGLISSPSLTIANVTSLQTTLDAESSARASADTSEANARAAAETAINAAIALKAADSTVVHNTGNETIAGTKTFSSAPAVPDNSFAESKVVNLVSDLALKANDNAVVHTSAFNTLGDARYPVLAATTNAFAGSQTIGGYLKVSSAGFNIGTPVASITDPLVFDTGGMHIWIPFAKDGPSSGNTGIKIFSANDFVGGLETYLQGTISLITATDPLDRRLKLGCTEQGTAQRNITLAEDGGFVGIGTPRPLTQFQITSGPASTAGIEMVRLDGNTVATGWTRSLTLGGSASGSWLEVSKLDSYVNGAERHTRLYAGGTLGLDLWQNAGIQIGGGTNTPPAGGLQLNSPANASGYTEMLRLEGSTISSGFERGIAFTGNAGGLEVGRITAYVTGGERHLRFYSAGALGFEVRETGIAVAPVGLSVGTNGQAATRIRHGFAILVAGTVTVSDANVTNNTRIIVTAQSLAGVSTPQPLAVSARTSGTSFTIASASSSDASTVAYEMIEP